LAEKKSHGKRISELAKELGVESKAIVQRLKDEQIPDADKLKYTSSISMGLAETVREWFKDVAVLKAAQEAAVAVAEAPAASETNVKTAPKRAKKSEAAGAGAGETPGADGSGDAMTATMEAPTAAPTKKRPVRKAPVKEGGEATVGETPAAPVAPVMKEVAPAAPVMPTKAPMAPAAPTVTAPMAPVVIPPMAPAAPVAPVAQTAPPTAKPQGPGGAGTGTAPPPTAPPSGGGALPNRPTITLANRPGAHAPPKAERKPVVPAAKLVTPAPAKMAGPRVVREEAPEVVPSPKPRRPMGQDAPPAFMQARPQQGRGVRVTEDDDEEVAKKKAAAKGKSLSSRRRGPDGRRGEAEEKLREFTDADLLERQERLAAASSYRTGFDQHLKRSESRGTHVQAKTAVERGGAVEIEEPITIKTLSAALGVKSNDIQGRLLKKNIAAGVNQTLDREMAQNIALEYGLELQIAQQKTLEDQLMDELSAQETDPEMLKPRPPVVTILGHVDHGKTSLLDKIRNANVAAGEAGGITQHTAAWMVELDGAEGKKKRVTFIDTPGHQAFTAMRARGANMTDVVVLVVSAAEGVQPQTIESINHARAAGVPIVVAMNKIDRPDADPNKVLGQLAKENLNPVEYGGETEVVRTSATTGQGVPELIEILDYQSELLELKANPSAPARGSVIEARVDEGLGSVATVLVQDGTLRIGDIMLAGNSFGRVRQLLNDRGEAIEEAGPAMPVIVSGLDELPTAGDKFYVLDDQERARSIAEERSNIARQQQLGTQNKVTADNLVATMKAGDVQTINLIIKGDVQGSVETLVNSVTGQNTEEVKVRVIHSGVGPVSESDVHLAMATKTKPTDNRVAIIGFNVVPEEPARALAEQNHIDVKTYRIIYEIFDDLKKALSGMLTPEEREKIHGHAEVRQVFKVSKVGNIAGCFVTDGHISRGIKIRLVRNGAVITEGIGIESLKRLKDDAKEVKAGLECGIKLAGYDDIKVGDVLEGYVKETFERTL